MVAPEFTGPYNASANGQCASGHPLNSYGRCAALNNPNSGHERREPLAETMARVGEGEAPTLPPPLRPRSPRIEKPERITRGIRHPRGVGSQGPR